MRTGSAVAALVVLAGVVDAVGVAVAQTSRNHLATASTRGNVLARAIDVATGLADWKDIAEVRGGIAHLLRTRIAILGTVRVGNAAIRWDWATSVKDQIADFALAALIIRVAATRDALDTGVRRRLADIALARAVRIDLAAERIERCARIGV